MKPISRMLKLIATGSVSLILAACYGVVYTMQQISGTFTVRSSETNEPIPGLKVTLAGAGVRDNGQTDDNGRFSFDVYPSGPEPVTATITDVDGTANGGDFGTAVVEYVDGGNRDVILDPR